MTHRVAALCVAAALAGAPRTAAAAIIDFQAMTSRDMPAQKAEPSALNGFAGELAWGWIGRTATGYSPTMYAYGVRLLDEARDPGVLLIRSTGRLVVSGLRSASARAPWLFDAYTPAIGGLGDAAQAAALHVAIWEALYDAPVSATADQLALLSPGAVAARTAQLLALIYAGLVGYSTTTTMWSS